ncbi:type I glyceraldehyde-3-phosphate dehydrogenase [Patescibacteria group bacterium]|nr:type I glyceraldehyde-3-phosphate dehydrogenase [Patescibacteria group bacterium]
MQKRIAINGFGRIGRLLFRQIVDGSSPAGELNVVAINDLGSVENLAYLLQYDSVYGKFAKEVQVKEDSLVVGGKEIRMLQEKDPAKLPWKSLKIDIAIEATGVFTSYEKASAHVKAGAKRVVITAPSKDEDSESAKTILMGVNHEQIQGCMISSNGSCTTNSVAPVIQVLHESLGIEKALLNTTHGYTATQSLVDGPTKSKDVRRGRAAAQNIVPSSTGAALAVTKAITDLQGKFDGIALRVPVIAGSIADITFLSKKNTSVEEINNILTKASKSSRWKDILAVTTEPLVSSDIIGQRYGAIVDLNMTRVVDGNLVKVLSWYDNEWGYVSTLVKHIELAAKNL